MDMKRSREAIITKVLEICCEGATKTRIVYQANLNFHTVVPYLNLLIEKGLVVCSKNDSVIYKTTSNGIKLLKDLKSIQGELPEIYGIANFNQKAHSAAISGDVGF